MEDFVVRVQIATINTLKYRLGEKVYRVGSNGIDIEVSRHHTVSVLKFQLTT